MKEPVPLPPRRTEEDAMLEFEYACRAWFASMGPAARTVALARAAELAATTAFDPSRPPR